MKNMQINEIIPYSKNPKKHSLQQINLIANSIKEFGFQNPIIIDKNNEIIAGHARYEAAKQLGLKEIPVIKAETLTKKQVHAYRLADNRLAELSQWDMDLVIEELKSLDAEHFDINITGFNVDEIINWMPPPIVDNPDALPTSFNRGVPGHTTAILSIHHLGAQLPISLLQQVVEILKKKANDPKESLLSLCFFIIDNENKFLRYTKSD